MLAALVTFAPAAAAADASCGEFNGTVFPGGPGLTKACEIDNAESVGATVYYWINDVKVYDENDVYQGGPNHPFADDWRVSVDTQQFITTGGLDLLKGGFVSVCDDRDITSFTNDAVGSGCRLSYVRPDNTLGGFDKRAFTVTLSLCDCGDQTPYIGWYISFTEHFTARVPMEAPKFLFDPSLN